MFDLQAARAHVLNTCQDHNIWLSEQPWRPLRQATSVAGQFGQGAEILVSPVKGRLSYLAALHEIGHCVLKHHHEGILYGHSTDRVIDWEYQAWDWAFAQAIYLDRLGYRLRHWALQRYHLHHFPHDRRIQLALNPHGSGQ